MLWEEPTAPPLLITVQARQSDLIFFSTSITPSLSLVKLPTVPKRIVSMAITNSCAAGRKMLRTRKQSILYTYMINCPKIGFTDRPRNIRNPGHIILPIMKILYFGLSIALFVSNIRAQRKLSNRTTTISIRGIVTSN